MPDGNLHYTSEIVDDRGEFPVIYALRSDGQVFIRNIKKILPFLKKKEQAKI